MKYCAVVAALLLAAAGMGGVSSAHAGKRKPITFAEYVANAPVKAPFVIAAYEEYMAAMGSGEGRDEVQPFQSLCTTHDVVRTDDGSTNVVVGDKIYHNRESRNDGCALPQNEPHIAVNPGNPDNLVAGANDYRFNNAGMAYVSFNGGKTWDNVRLPGVEVGGDPVVAFDPRKEANTVYYVNLYFNEIGTNALLVSKSTDGGITWGKPTEVVAGDGLVYFHDKPWLGVDQQGRVYVTWTKFEFDWNGYVESPIMIARSDDGGKTFTEPREVDKRHPYSQGSRIGFAPDGRVYVASEGTSPIGNLDTDALVVSYSDDRGEHFVSQEVTRIYDDINCYPLSWTTYRQHLTGYQFRINSYPSMSIDPHTGKIYIAFADNEGVGTCGKQPIITMYPNLNLFQGETANRVKVVMSMDGKTWKVKPYPHDNGVFPAIAANKGKWAMAYYRPANGEGCSPDGVTNANGCIETIIRGDTGSRRIAAPSNTYTAFGGEFIGDYIGLVIGSDMVAHAVWTDSRGSKQGINQDVYYAGVTMQEARQSYITGIVLAFISVMAVAAAYIVRRRVQ